MKPWFCLLALAALASTADARPVKIERNSAALEFSYEWPSQAAAIPALDKRFRRDLDKAFREAVASANADRKLARAQEREFHGHFFSMTWRTAGETPRLLSLEGELGFFTGGAHPNTNRSALLWDRRLGREIAVTEQFLHPRSFATLTGAAYCRQLDAERLERRDGEKLGGEFDDCPKFSELAIAPADKDRDGRFDAIRFTASPYVAGPYVEGEYEIEIGVTRQLIAALKPAYRSSYEPQRQ